MEAKIAKMNEDGEIVIPSEIREESGVEGSDEFVVFGKDGMVVLKKIDKETLEESFNKIERIWKDRAVG